MPFLVTLRAPITTGITTVLICHMRAISIPRSLYLDNLPGTLMRVCLSDGMATSIRVHLFPRLFLIMMSGRFAVIVLSVWISMS